jgi:hypothetical protein
MAKEQSGEPALGRVLVVQSGRERDPDGDFRFAAQSGSAARGRPSRCFWEPADMAVIAEIRCAEFWPGRPCNDPHKRVESLLDGR